MGMFVLKKNIIRITSVVLVLVMLFSAFSSATLASAGLIADYKATREAEKNAMIDEMVEIARSKIGFYGDYINEFTTWYYGYETSAYWCSIFVSWSADQVGALGTSVPKRAACSSMMYWFQRRGQFHAGDSDYVPQKGDIIFLNTDTEGVDPYGVHHVEIVTQSDFIMRGGAKYVRCIGGNTSDLNYLGSEYVTEKVRPVTGPRAKVIGYAHPDYKASLGIVSDSHKFANSIRPAFITNLQSKFISLLYKIETMWFDFTMKVEQSVEDTRRKTDEFFANFGKKKEEVPTEVSPESQTQPVAS